jgi:RNA polymerase sigma-70 factor, ECF subfamily
VGGDNHDCFGIPMSFAERKQRGGVRVAAEGGHRRTVREESGGGGGHRLSDAEGGCYDAGVAREEVLARLRERIVGFAASQLSRDAAEDLAQEVLMLLHEKYAHLERAEDLLPLSLQIVRFKIMSLRRKTARRGEYTQVSVTDIPLPDPDASPLDYVERKEMRERLGRAMGQLGDRCRELMRLKLQGRSFPEIQKAMGAAAINTIYTWDHRCRKPLLELMGGKWES